MYVRTRDKQCFQARKVIKGECFDVSNVIASEIPKLKNRLRKPKENNEKKRFQINDKTLV